jgi:hypothetical protein
MTNWRQWLIPGTRYATVWQLTFIIRWGIILLLFQVGAVRAACAQQPLTPTQWQQDLQVALDSLPAHDRSFSPTARAIFQARVAQLRDSVAFKTEPQLIVGLARAVAGAGNAHTRLYLLRNRTELRRYPVRLWWFKVGLYVVRTTAEYADLLGAKVVSWAGKTPQAARRAVAPLYAGNASWRTYMSTYTLTSPEILLGLGLIDSSGTLILTCRTRQGRQVTRSVVPLPLAKVSQPTEAWWDLAPTHPGGGAAWQHILASDTAQLPLYLRLPQQFYWVRYLPKPQLLYVQYNRAGNMPTGESFALFGRRVLAMLATHKPRKVVVDVRFNTGGNLDVARHFMGQLDSAARRQQARVYVITGQATFSAGLFHAAQLRELAQATIVGEPAGDELDFWAEGGNLLLPNSKLTLHYADRFHSYSPAPRPDATPYLYLDLAVATVQPRYLVRLRWRDYLTGGDAALRKIIRD